MTRVDLVWVTWVPGQPGTAPLGVVDHCERSLKAVACMFAGYHAVKREIGNSHNSELPLTEHDIKRAHSMFCEHFAAAADDCCLRIERH